jgi:hypothetical protein
VIRGQHGTIEFGDRLTIREQAEWWKEFRRTNAGLVEHQMERKDDGQEKPRPDPGQASFQIHPSPRRDHMGNFIDSVRGLDKPNCNADLGCSTMTAIKMGVESYRRNKTMLWDAQKEQMIES